VLDSQPVTLFSGLGWLVHSEAALHKTMLFDCYVTNPISSAL